MHEWALAESIITTVLEASKKEKLKEITKVNILLGELQARRSLRWDLCAEALHGHCDAATAMDT